MRVAEAATFETTGPEQTEAVAAGLAARLKAGDVVLVGGGLGAGKTTFVRGACRALGVRGPVLSPTFTIGRRYDDGRVGISHVDLFRLGDLAEEDPGLLADYVTHDRISFIEWPEGAEPALTAVRVAARVCLEHAGGDRRRVEVRR
jgi:tRNA threonylcarbamoyladenosine biosynthesis protein TsaE